jgi:hypothetical protein
MRPSHGLCPFGSSGHGTIPLLRVGKQFEMFEATHMHCGPHCTHVSVTSARKKPRLHRQSRDSVAEGEAVMVNELVLASRNAGCRADKPGHVKDGLTESALRRTKALGDTLPLLRYGSKDIPVCSRRII